MPSPTPPAACPETPIATRDLPCVTCDAGEVYAAQEFDCRGFRDTLGAFATGVTVVTALDASGQPIGMTISSFNSVSLDPPLILWSLSKASPSLTAFKAASHYSVNVLAANQQALSDRFASRIENRFDGVPTHAGIDGLPLLDGCCAWFECHNEIRHEGGDHLIFVGRVERFTPGEEKLPLVFHGGRYRELAVVF